jgi:hypothetical protein
MQTIALFIAAALGFLSFNGEAKGPQHPGYYSTEFYEKYDQLNNTDLIKTLNAILKGGHVQQKNGYDVIYTNCSGLENCYSHINLGYREARQHLFGNLHLEPFKGGFTVTEVYCENTISSSQTTIGPGLIPEVKYMNAEHTWPQSRFTSRYPKDVQKCDLHNLFPTDSEMNSHRSSLRFGKVVREMEELKCQNSRLGTSENGDVIFEPPTNHKGNVARAIFYFAARYEMQISNEEEATLREWHNDDPVDMDEYERQEKIYSIQKVRNPFIDFPDLLEKIENF